MVKITYRGYEIEYTTQRVRELMTYAVLKDGKQVAHLSNVDESQVYDWIDNHKRSQETIR